MIDSQLRGTDVVIVLIGPRYFTVANPSGGARIREPGDTVHTEVRVALERGKTVIPVLVDGADQPSAEDFPDDLRELAYRQSYRIASKADLDNLVALLRPGVVAAGKGQIPAPGSHALPGMWSTFRDDRDDVPRVITSATRELIEMGWLLDPALGENALRHPDSPQYRMRVGPRAVVWLDQRRRGPLGQLRWAPLHPFPIMSAFSTETQLFSLPKDLKRAATNPDAFLDSERTKN